MTDKREHWRRQRLLEDIAALDGLLAQHQRNLRTIEKTIAQVGMAPSLEWVNQREAAKRQIEATERELEDKERELAALPPPPVPEAPPAESEEEQADLGRLPFEPEMILIPAGEFLMGSDPRKDRDARGSECPQHALYLPDYTMAKTPVTNAQYAEFVIRGVGIVEPPEHWWKGDPQPGKLDHSVVYVSWHDAVDYCDWLADITGKPYRLPSEAEWEKAARGTDGRNYPWGNRWYPAWCNAGEDTRLGIVDTVGGGGGTTPVGAYPRGASPYGVLDMAGNVWELTRSLCKEYPYDAGDGREDLQAAGARVVRGGSWGSSRDCARCAYRYWYPPHAGSPSGGFRVVVSPISFWFLNC